MNILNKLKPTLLVMSIIILLPTVSYAMEKDQGEHTRLSARPSISDEDFPTYTNEGTKDLPKHSGDNPYTREEHFEKAMPGRE